MNEDLILALYARAALAKDAGIPMTPPSLASRTEVDKVMQQAEGAGARVIDPPRARFWGGYSGYFQDPVR
jgi:uncharacterized glyoxalase superfamily protein PhnB